MLVGTLIGEDVLAKAYRRVIIPVACNATNVTEMHIRLAQRCRWPGLRDTSFLELGDLSSHDFGNFTFYAAACMEYAGERCLVHPEALTACLDALTVGEGEVIALVLMSVSQAQLDLILVGVQKSQQRVMVFLPEQPRPARRPAFEDQDDRHGERHLSRKELGLESAF